MGLPPNATTQMRAMDDLIRSLTACRLCTARFAATATAHHPRPVVWFRPGARLLVAGQAPGMRVHLTGRPFNDASGDRLRAWMGVTSDQFYDLTRVAVVPMAFCFPGYNAKGADLPPPAICAATWRQPVLAGLPNLRLRLLIGGAAMRWHLGPGKVADFVARWQDLARTGTYPLPHPSWRNTGWLRRNSWFEAEVVPQLQCCVAKVLAE